MNISIKKLFFSISDQILKAILLERIFSTKNVFLMNAFNTGRQMIVFFEILAFEKPDSKAKHVKIFFNLELYALVS